METRRGREVIAYLIFGVLTTLVNIVVYTLCARVFGLPVALSNVLAWLLSVLFAYVTNRKWVFESRTTGIKELAKECMGFFAGRLATGVFDTVVMVVSVDILGLNDIIMKIVSNGIVIVLNYLISKLIVFRKKEVHDVQSRYFFEKVGK